MNLLKSIRTLRILALLLFIVPSIGLIGSLLIHNHLISFKFTKDFNFNFATNEPGQFALTLCDKTNNYCSDDYWITFKKFNKLNECYKYEIKRYIVDKNGKDLNNIQLSEIKNSEEKIFSKLQIINLVNDDCILNSKKLFWYNLFPFYFESIYNLLEYKETTLGTSYIVNPFFKGETSISNIVKRFPIKFFFKPVLFLTVII